LRWICFSFTVSLVEPLDSAGGVYQLLLSSEERVASGAHLQSNLGFSGTRLEFVSTSAGYCHFMVLWMNCFFHFNLIYGLIANYCPEINAYYSIGRACFAINLFVKTPRISLISRIFL
jgi:hypothetical protein